MNTRGEKDKMPSEKALETNRALSTSDNSFPPSVQTHLYILQKVAYKISEDRKNFMSTVPEESSPFQDHYLEDLLSRQSSMEVALCEDLEQKRLAKDHHFENILRKLEALRVDFLTLRNQIIFPEPDFTRTALSSKAAAILAQDAALREQEQNSELIDCIEAEVKEWLEKHASEIKLNGREIMQRIYRFLEQSHKDIQREINIFSSVLTTNDEEERGKENFSLVTEVEKIEKNLLETFILLNRQRFEIENLNKTLKYFNGKFHLVISKFDANWQQSEATYGSAAQRLEKTGGQWICTAKRMDRSSRCLIQQSRILRVILSTMEDVVKKQPETTHLPTNPNELDEEMDVHSAATELPSIQTVDEFNKKLKDLVLLTETTGENLHSLTQSSQKLDGLQDLVRSVATGYDSLLSSLLSLTEKSENRISSPEPDVENLDTSVMMYNNNKDMQLAGNNFTENTNNLVRNNSNTIDAYKVACCELSRKLENKDVKLIMFLLRDIVEATWKLVNRDKCIANEESEESSQKSDYTRTTEINEDWEDYPSESFLSDVSSDCLVQNSSDSDLATIE